MSIHRFQTDFAMIAKKRTQQNSRATTRPSKPIVESPQALTGAHRDTQSGAFGEMLSVSDINIIGQHIEWEQHNEQGHSHPELVSPLPTLETSR